jgi:hypothetical protein
MGFATTTKKQDLNCLLDIEPCYSAVYVSRDLEIRHKMNKIKRIWKLWLKFPSHDIKSAAFTSVFGIRAFYSPVHMYVEIGK